MYIKYDTQNGNPNNLHRAPITNTITRCAVVPSVGGDREKGEGEKGVCSGAECVGRWGRGRGEKGCAVVPSAVW